MNEGALPSAIVDEIRPHVTNKEALATATSETDLFDDLRVNSARMVEITLALEDRFDIEIPDDAIDRLLTLGDIVALVVELRRA